MECIRARERKRQRHTDVIVSHLILSYPHARCSVLVAYFHHLLHAASTARQGNISHDLPIFYFLTVFTVFCNGLCPQLPRPFAPHAQSSPARICSCGPTSENWACASVEFGQSIIICSSIDVESHEHTTAIYLYPCKLPANTVYIIDAPCRDSNSHHHADYSYLNHSCSAPYDKCYSNRVNTFNVSLMRSN